MQRIVVLLVGLLLSTMIAYAAPGTLVPQNNDQEQVEQGHAYIPRGTILRAKLLETLDSRTSKAGDKFSFKLLHNVIIANTLVIAQGTVGEGVVKSVKRPGMFGKGGAIDLEAVSIKAQNGIEIPLTMQQRKADGGHKADMDWYDNASSATPALTIGVLSGITGGTDVQIGAGAKLLITLPINVDLKASPADLAKVMMPDAILNQPPKQDLN